MVVKIRIISVPRVIGRLVPTLHAVVQVKRSKFFPLGPKNIGKMDGEREGQKGRFGCVFPCDV